MNLRLSAILTIFVLGGLLTMGCQHANHHGTERIAAWQPEDVSRMPPVPMKTRWYTFENPKGEKGAAGTVNFGRKGAPATTVMPGDTLVLADIQDIGTIRHIWMAGPTTTEFLRGVKIEIYWDGADSPAVQAPAGDFFGHGFGKWTKFENTFFSSPEGRSLNSFVPMPFKSAAKIQIVNESAIPHVVYYEVDVTLGDAHGDDMLYFHSYWRRENPTKIRKDMTILPRIEGRGRFLGCHLGSHLDPKYPGWWGEGEVKIYLDGDTDLPTLAGTGTEDYIGTGYGQGWFWSPNYGNPYVSPAQDAFSYYRFHVVDPVFFYQDIRVTIQNIGAPAYEWMLTAMDQHPGLRFMRTGEGSESDYYTREDLQAAIDNKTPVTLAERSDDCYATAYWYLDRPENGLPDIAPVEERMADLPEGPVWNEAYRTMTIE
jgi:hypothetical protein